MSKEYQEEVEKKFGGKINKMEYLDEFQELMKDRLCMGTERYGDWGYHFGDNMKDILEEIIDMANYAYFFFTRMRWLERHWSGEIKDIVNPCRCKDISYLPMEEKNQVRELFEAWHVCYWDGEGEKHFCLTATGERIKEHGR